MGITEQDVLDAMLEFQADLQADPELVPRLFEEGWTVIRIANHTGLHRSTVYRRLEKAGLVAKGGGKKDECQRGHDMKVWGVEIPKKRGSGRFCRMCKRLRERKGGIK